MYWDQGKGYILPLPRPHPHTHTDGKYFDRRISPIWLYFRNQTLLVDVQPRTGRQGRIKGGFLCGFDLIILPCLLCVYGQTSLSKQCRHRSDAAQCGVWSGSTLFATHPAILHTFTNSKMDLLKRSISIPKLSNLFNISYENETLKKRGWGWSF